MADGLLQPRIGGLYHGVSRQAPLQRAPNQMQELDNFLPSVDLGAIADRDGTKAIVALTAASYATQGHHFFRTTDGQRWVLLKRVEHGLVEVRNLATGVEASVAYGPWVLNYLAQATNLKYLSLSDTTFILNPSVPVQVTQPAAPTISAVYVVIRKLSTAAQSFNVSCSAGAGSWALGQGGGGIVTRDFVALGLAGNCSANMPGVNVTRVTGNVIKFSGPTAIIQTIQASNDWDESAMLLIKGRVSAISDLPGTFEHGTPILVDLGFADASTAYYVMYDSVRSAWVECSYLQNGATTADLHEGTMPVKLRQIGPNSFSLDAVDWVPRKSGDNDSNPLPPFIGKTITAMTQWKGRLWLGSDDTVIGSQPDDLFNFFRDSAREVKPSDPVMLPIESPDLGVVRHLVAFRNKLMVMSDTAQLELDPGNQPVKPDTASLGVATRYSLDQDCEPSVIGDVLMYTGVTENRAVLWEYSYEQESANNTATDLSKHVPGYCPGAVKRIRGSSTAGRTYVWSAKDPGRLYVNTGYWKEGQRAQNAWSRMSFPGVTNIQDHWVSGGTLFLLAVASGALWLLSVDVDANLGESYPDHLRLDLQSRVQITWNSVRNRSEVMLPLGYVPYASTLLCTVNVGGQWRGYPLTVVWDGTQWLGHFATQTGQGFGYLGVRFTRTATFSPFYPSLGETTTPIGRLQVRTVVVDALVSGDFTATVTRTDRVPMTVARSPRMIGEALVPDIGANLQHAIPFNSKGDQATLSISTDSFGPMALSGFTLLGRYTNPTAP
jgi:hypothetical protein